MRKQIWITVRAAAFFAALFYFQDASASGSGDRPIDQGAGYARGEVLVKFKEGSSPDAALGKANINALSMQRVHSIAPAAAKFRKECQLEKTSDGWYSFLGKNYKDAQDITDETAFEEAYKNMPEAEKSLYRTYRIILPEGVSVEEAVRLLSADPEVEYAEPNRIVKALWTPDDPYYASSGSWGQSYDDLWGIKKIICQDAWEFTKGEGVVIAIIDSGVDFTHPDLAGNMWVNSDEIPANGIDDDSNGYKDDTMGWDFFYMDNDPMDNCGHGSHCAGIAAAVGNNGKGIVGVAPGAGIMAVQGLSRYGSGFDSDLADGVKYAADNGADILSCSWGGSGTSQTLTDAFHYADLKGCVCIAAAGNDNVNVSDFTPANIDTVIAVSAFDQNDQKCSFSNYGTKIDVAAPGGMSNILSTMPDSSYLATAYPGYKVANGYYRLQGTSMACPYVSGTAALIKSRYPDASQAEVLGILRGTADDVGAAGFDIYSGYGRVNAKKAVYTQSAFNAVITSPAAGGYISNPAGPVIGYAETSNSSLFHDYTLEIGSGTAPTNWIFISSGATPVSGGQLGTLNFNAGEINGPATLRLTVTDNLGHTAVVSHSVIVMNDTHPGWPTSSLYKSSYGLSCFNDIDMDGASEIILDQYVQVCALKSDGSFTQGWPIRYGSSGKSSSGIIDATGKPAVVFALGATIYAYRPDGTASPGFPVRITGNWLNSTAAPLLADLDNDGACEIIIDIVDTNTYSTKIYVIKGDGTFAAGWPVTINGAGLKVIYLLSADFNMDGYTEVAYIAVNNDGMDCCAIYDRNGQLLPGWPVIADESSSGTAYMPKAAAGDINNDGKPELVFASTIGSINKVHVIRAYKPDGSVVPGWPIAPGQDITAVPAIALGDLTGDGVPEVVAMASKASAFNLCAYSGSGRAVAGWPVTVNNTVPSSVLIGDVNGDLKPDVVAVSNGRMDAFSCDGSTVAGWPKHFTGSNNVSATMGDADGDSKLEILVGGGNSSYTYLFDLEGSVSQDTLYWPTFGQNPQRTGCYAPPKTRLLNADADGDGADNIVISGGPEEGVNINYNNSSWAKISSIPCRLMSAGQFDSDPQDELAMDFGSGYGLWIYGGDSTWTKLSSESAEDIVCANLDNDAQGVSELVINFGFDHGLWVLYNGFEWRNLVSWIGPEDMCAADINADGRDEIIGDFGPAYGVWVYEPVSGQWRQIANITPKAISAGNIDGDADGKQDIVMDFGPDYGIWIYYNGLSWSQLVSSTAKSVIAGDMDGNGKAEVIGDFGPAGVWSYSLSSGQWLKLADISPDSMIAADIDNDPGSRSDIIADFGRAQGIWVYYDGSGKWSRPGA